MGWSAWGDHMPPGDNTLRQALYERVCESYQAIDDFRTKLLGLLPVATGTGVFLLLSGKAQLVGDVEARVSDALLAIGIFGFLFTFGLFAYELFGIKKCHYLIVTGKHLEEQMGVPGQFQSRPRDLAGFINEPYASAIIYPASMAAWAFLAIALRSSTIAALVALAVFVVGYKATRIGAKRIKENQEHEELVLDVVGRPNATTLDTLRTEARLWERRHSQPPPTGVKGRVHRLELRAKRVGERLWAGRQRDWVDTIVRRLEWQGDLEQKGERLCLPNDSEQRRWSAGGSPATTATGS